MLHLKHVESTRHTLPLSLHMLAMSLHLKKCTWEDKYMCHHEFPSTISIFFLSLLFIFNYFIILYSVKGNKITYSLPYIYICQYIYIRGVTAHWSHDSVQVLCFRGDNAFLRRHFNYIQPQVSKSVTGGPQLSRV